MRTRVLTKIGPLVAAFLFLLAYAGHGGAAEPYDPKDDPNYAPETSGKLPVGKEAVQELIKEFEGQAMPKGERHPGAAQSAPGQPQQYTQGTTLPAPRVSSQDPVFGDTFAYPYSPYGERYRWWWAGSPRIPWWSLIPFARGDEDFLHHAGDFNFGHPHGGHSQFGFVHHD